MHSFQALRLRASVALILAACASAPTAPVPKKTARYQDLVALFADWRAFQKPPIADGVPDYSPPAMAAQHRGLERYRVRLAEIDASGWPLTQQVDYHLLRAEMNGFEFDHRVLGGHRRVTLQQREL